MAVKHTPDHQRTQLARRPSGVPCMSERQLDAYLQTRETLRRLRAGATLPSNLQQPPPPTRAA